MKLTDKQQEAIDIRNANVLVSAAAGSGKTSVLVERIVRRITGEGNGPGESPIDIDRLLIMTFTKAAASEMKARIRDVIDKRLEEQRSKADSGTEEQLALLERQSLLVHHAMITTIHGFCKSIITDHFEELDLDPNFRVADENECKLIMQDVLEECMEAAYKKADPGFLRLVECFSGARSDEGLAKMVIPLYRFMIDDPDPEAFIRKCCRNHEFETYEDFARSDLWHLFVSVLESGLSRAEEYAEAAEHIIDGCPAIEGYRPHIESYREALEQTREQIASKSDTVQSIIDLASFNPAPLGRIKSAGLSEEDLARKKKFTDFRDKVKAVISNLRGMISMTQGSAFERSKSVKAELGALCDLVIDFKRIYDAKKRDANIIDYNDMEHMAISVLGRADIAAVYREHFEEIYVDEYQDSNMIQEKLVSYICRHDPGNVFCVGDVKQSIYSFRGARPDLFLARYNTYTDNTGGDRRILLNDNFRSRREVVDAVNEVFFRIMKSDLGGIEYDEAAKLHFGASCYDGFSGDEQDFGAQIIIGDLSEGELSADEFNANIIANRITSLIRSGFIIYDKHTESFRPVSFRDFTILVRSLRNCEKEFREVFAGAGIPLAVTGKEGYFGTVEIKTVMAFLQSVDNPLCDIPLAAFALSPVGGFTEADMAKLTSAAGSGICLYDRIKRTDAVPAEEQEDKDLADKCRSLLHLLDKYKAMSVYTTVYGILTDFIDNEYADHVKCMSSPDQRMANLSMLLSKAEDYGKTSFTGLYSFVRYMDQIRKYNIDDGEASIVSDNEDTVRLMTIHASKGLEFPVCFVAGLEKNRNKQDERGNPVVSSRYGFGMGYTDLDRRIKGTTLPKELIKIAVGRDAVAEEMRLLYVAMTRAREKLILTGCCKGECFGELGKSMDESSSYLDMLNKAYGAEGFSHIDVSYVTPEDVVSERMAGTLEKEQNAEDLLNVVRDHMKRGDDPDRKQKVPGYLEYAIRPYPYPINNDLRAKLSVSDLKHKAIEEEIARGLELVPEGEQLFAETEPEKYIPKFMRPEGMTEKGGTFYGSAFHRIMELWDYSSLTEEDIEDYVAKMHALHRMDKDQADAIRVDDVACFLRSALGMRMKKAANENRLYREQPFVIGIEEAGETILVQGIIDAYFIEDDGITIVDYKTDSVTDEQMLVNRYKAQLAYYGKALSQITGKKIKSMIIYSTRLRREVPIPDTKEGLQAV